MSPPSLTGREPSRGGARRRALVAAASCAALIGLVTDAAGLWSRLETGTIAVRAHSVQASAPSDVTLVAIDDRTFSELGRAWPFPRRLHAGVIDRLRRAGARTVVYDVQFTERTREADDLALFDAVRRMPGTVLATTEVDDHGHTNVLGGDENVAAAHAVAAASNVRPDPGGAITRYDADLAGVPSLPVAAAKSALGRRLGAASFDHGRAWIDYRGPPGTLRTLSFSDVLRGNFDAAAVRGRVIVVGPTAPTFQDAHLTPTSSRTPMAGAEVQANAIWTALHGNPLRGAPWWTAALTSLLAGLLAPLLALRIGLWRTTLAWVGVVVLYVGACVLAYRSGTVLTMAGTLVASAIGLLSAVVGSYVFSDRERRRVTSHNELLDSAVHARTSELRQTQLEIVERLAHAAESRDQEATQHLQRMSMLARDLGRLAGMSEDEAELLRHASVLHDVGKIGIPDRVLLKPGRLDDEERAVMETHAAIGADILVGSGSRLIQTAERIARTHHERWDGAGYPAGLRGEEIPLEGRICAICDVFDALLTPRRYKAAWPTDTAVDAIRQDRGTRFDPALVDLFLPVARELERKLPPPAAAPDATPSSPDRAFEAIVAAIEAAQRSSA